MGESLRFDERFRERVRDANNIVDVIGEYTSLKRTGHRHTGLCPFPDHREKTPSFSVDENKQFYYCFGCKKAGDIYKFVMEMKGVNFPGAVEYLAERAHIPLPAESVQAAVQQSQRQAKKRTLTETNKLAMEFFKSQLAALPTQNLVREYLRKRGMSPAIINQFCLGYAPENSAQLKEVLLSRGVSLEVAQNLGLLKKSEAGELRNLFWRRIMFPIVSPTGDVIGFGGRVLDDSLPKYINSSESELFHKGRVLYGLNESSKHIRSEDQAIVVEGYMDFLALFAGGFKNVVATLGTALTSEHAKLIKRFTRNVLVLFDGDSAGIAAAEKSLPVLLNEGLLPRALILPEELDPDEFLRARGAEALKAAIDGAPELFFVYLDHATKGFSGQPSDAVAIIDRISPVLLAAKDLRLRELYFAETAFRLDVELAWLKVQIRSQEVPKLAATQGSGHESVEIVDDSDDQEALDISNAPRVELVFLNLALHRQRYLDEILSANWVEKLTHQGVKGVLAKAQAMSGHSSSHFDRLGALLSPYVEPAHNLTLFMQTEFANLTAEEEQRLFEDCKSRIEQNSHKREARKMRIELKSSPATNSEKKLEQIVNIHRKRLALNKEKN